MMQLVQAADGTHIACHFVGEGKPLLLVHGTGGSSTRWSPILPVLMQRFLVCAMDRRGRGSSGDASTYALQREFEDVAAVVESFNEPVDVLAHSYGAVCALEAALLTGNVDRLALYEPPIQVTGVKGYSSSLIRRMEEQLHAGDRSGVVTTFLREVVRVSDHELGLLQASPTWTARVAAAPTLPRELRALNTYRFAPERFQDIRTPILLLVGSVSPPRFKAPIEELVKRLPSSRVVVLPGQQHVAMDTAPELFLDVALSFFAFEERNRPAP